MCKSGTNEEVTLLKEKLFSGRRTVPIDACIAHLVQALNDYGIETIACCCGHGKAAKSSIRISSKSIRLLSLADDFAVHLEFPYRKPKED